MRASLFLVLLSACLDRRLPDAGGDWSWEGGTTASRVPVRVATWNVQGVGVPDSVEYAATLAVLRRLDADIVGLNEVSEGESAALAALAADAGYAVVESPGRQPFGDLGNAVLSRLPVVAVEQPDARDLSGDPAALDMTRLPVVLTATVPGTGLELTVVTQHWKSGFEPTDVFRRAVDGWRTAQAAAAGIDSDLLVVMGDVNAEEQDMPEAPGSWTSLPDGLPFDYTLGSDLAARVAGEGLSSDPYAALVEQGLRPVDAAQRDGDRSTRPLSGRRIDRIFVTAAVRAAGLRAEVYDTRDDTPAQPGLAAGGERPEPGDVLRASDHLPVMVELRVAAE